MTTRTWTSIGEELLDRDAAKRDGHHSTTRDALERSIEGLTWKPVEPDLTLPAGAGLAINKAIEALELRAVSEVAVGWISGIPYEMLGIATRFSDGDARIYLVDRGSDLLVVASDFTKRT